MKIENMWWLTAAMIQVERNPKAPDLFLEHWDGVDWWSIFIEFHMLSFKVTSSMPVELQKGYCKQGAFTHSSEKCLLKTMMFLGTQTGTKENLSWTYLSVYVVMFCTICKTFYKLPDLNLLGASGHLSAIWWQPLLLQLSQVSLFETRFNFCSSEVTRPDRQKQLL